NDARGAAALRGDRARRPPGGAAVRRADPSRLSRREGGPVPSARRGAAPQRDRGGPRRQLRGLGGGARRAAPRDLPGRAVRGPLDVLLACGLAGLALACGRDAKPTAERAAQVRTARVETGTITDWIRLYGRIVPPPDRDATLAPLVAGALVAVPV